MQVSFHRFAQQEVIDAACYYEDKKADLGTEFLDELDKAIRRIVAAPEQFAVVRGTIRRCPIDRFPYAIYFRAQSERIRVIVVRHHARQPNHGMQRR